MDGGEPYRKLFSGAKSRRFRLCLSLPTLALLLIAGPLFAAAAVLLSHSLAHELLSVSESAVTIAGLVLVGTISVLGAAMLAAPIHRLANTFRSNGGGNLPPVGWKELKELRRALSERCTECLVEAESRQNTEGRFRGYVETMAEGLVVVNREERITFANPRFARMLGFEPEDLLGNDLPSYLDEHNRARLKRETRRRRRGLTSKYELEWRRADGARIPSVVSASPLRDQNCRTVGSFAVVTDLTEQRRMEDHLVRAERLKALGELAGGVAHDFNNRLTTILGNAQLLLLDEDRPEVRRGIEIIERTAISGGQMVQGLIAFTRKSAEGTREDIELNSLAHDVVGLSSLGLTSEKRPSSPIRFSLLSTRAARAYAGELREALLCVLANATEAIREGGTVHLSTYDHNDGVAIRVEDDGEGMSPGTLARAFDPFFTTRGPQRTGLGLSIAHGILRRNGGVLNLSSDLNLGTSVEFVLPASEALWPPEDAPTRKSLGFAEQQVITLAMDRSAQNALSAELARHHIELEAFDTAEKILETLATRRVHLLLADPDREGIALAQASRRISPTTRVLLVTDWTEEEVRLLSFEPFVDRVLKGPVSTSTLVSAVAGELAPTTT
jgi:PAS domain S-box-containing protein